MELTFDIDSVLEKLVFMLEGKLVHLLDLELLVAVCRLQQDLGIRCLEPGVRNLTRTGLWAVCPQATRSAVALTVASRLSAGSALGSLGPTGSACD